MNNFITSDNDSKSKVPKHLESLTTTAFQSLFPPINPQTTPLKSIKRVLLLNREVDPDDDSSFILNFRHYAITTKTVGISKPLKRLNAAEKILHSKQGRKGLPNLGRMQDIADFMIGGENGDGYMTDGGTSGSEVDTDAEVEITETVTRKVLNSKARAAAKAAAAEENDKDAAEAHDNVERRAVKLVELGPRMRLRMTKVEEGVCAGKVMWHEYVNKSPEEIKELEKKWQQRQREKEARRKQQKENVEKKKAEKEAHKKASAQGQGGAAAADDDDEDEDDMDVDSDGYGYEDGFDSEGLAGDAEEQVNARMEENGEWEDEEDEIAAG